MRFGQQEVWRQEPWVRQAWFREPSVRGSRPSSIYFAIKPSCLQTQWTATRVRPARLRRYNPPRAHVSPNPRVAGLRGLCNHPNILAGHPPSSGLLETTETLVVSRVDTALDCDVDRGGHDHRFLARRGALRDRVELATRGLHLRSRIVDLQKLRRRLPRGAAGRPSRNPPRTS